MTSPCCDIRMHIGMLFEDEYELNFECVGDEVMPCAYAGECGQQPKMWQSCDYAPAKLAALRTMLKRVVGEIRSLKREAQP